MGIEFLLYLPSPRRWNTVTGPLTQNMTNAIKLVLTNKVPNPKIIILFGACAISGGIFKTQK
ncbi:MAG: hypothetical protein IPJ03_15000 [Ignavibacteriales bacterium]|nr:hypothetical protein [Ignavibacteriales bacterium]